MYINEVPPGETFSERIFQMVLRQNKSTVVADICTVFRYECWQYKFFEKNNIHVFYVYNNVVLHYYIEKERHVINIHVVH